MGSRTIATRNPLSSVARRTTRPVWSGIAGATNASRTAAVTAAMAEKRNAFIRFWLRFYTEVPDGGFRLRSRISCAEGGTPRTLLVAPTTYAKPFGDPNHRQTGLGPSCVGACDDRF